MYGTALVTSSSTNHHDDTWSGDTEAQTVCQYRHCYVRTAVPTSKPVRTERKEMALCHTDNASSTT